MKKNCLQYIIQLIANNTLSSNTVNVEILFTYGTDLSTCTIISYFVERAQETIFFQHGSHKGK